MLIIGVSLAAALKLLIPPVVVYQNELLVPVQVSINDRLQTAFTLRAGARRAVRSVGISKASWIALSPYDGSRLHVGVLRSGQFEEPSVPLLLQRMLYVRYERRINRDGPGGKFFVPVVINTWARAVRFSVQQTPGRRFSCECSIANGGRRTFTGYYPVARARVVIEDMSGTELYQVIVDDRVIVGAGIFDVSVPMRVPDAVGGARSR